MSVTVEVRESETCVCQRRERERERDLRLRHVGHRAGRHHPRAERSSLRNCSRVEDLRGSTLFVVPRTSGRRKPQEPVRGSRAHASSAPLLGVRVRGRVVRDEATPHRPSRPRMCVQRSRGIACASRAFCRRAAQKGRGNRREERERERESKQRAPGREGGGGGQQPGRMQHTTITSPSDAHPRTCTKDPEVQNTSSGQFRFTSSGSSSRSYALKPGGSTKWT